MQKLTCFFATALLSIGGLFAQNDPVLFSVDDIEVPLSEFRYIYTKNNRDNADYSRASVSEYLDLYTRFKLKVKRARDLRLDTIPSLQSELAGYRKQLAKSYLNDKEVIEKLTREAYDRVLWDIHVAHILISVEPSFTPEQLLAAETKAAEAARRAKAGENFAVLAKELSEDPNTNSTGGDLGYLTALLPSGFYAAENVIYSLADGQVSDPVRSSLGIHVFKVLDRRPARGEIEAGHIFVRVKPDSSNDAAARQKIYAVHQNLKDGKTFEDLAANVSDDNQTARRGGYIGRFGINSYDPVFEDAAFALTEGNYSEPVRTRVGWHIIRVLKKFVPGTFDEERTRLEARVSRDERVNVAKASMIQNIRRESGLTENPDALNAFLSSLDEDFLTFQWNAPEDQRAVLVQLNDGTAKTTGEFVQYLRTRTRERMRAAKTTPPETVGATLYAEWIDEICLAYEEARLEDKYPDFRALMREYEEGILLFEVTKMVVWDKASQDSAGLANFHAARRENYMWPERAEVLHFTVQGAKAVKTAEKARKLLAKQPVDEVVSKLNKSQQQITYHRKRYLQDELNNDGMEWKQGWMSPLTTGTDNTQQTFSLVSQLLPPQPKALEEARGYIVADYQDYLEKEWVESLRKEYDVKVYQDALNGLIRN